MENLERILQTEVGLRDETWEKAFFSALVEERFKLLSPEAKEGPDHWPYLMVATGDDADEPARNVLGWLSSRGIGLAINPQKATPDFVFTYGMIWNFRERGEFISPMPERKSGSFDIKPGQELMAGPPSEGFFPSYARNVLRQFFADQGVFTPKVLMVAFDGVNFDLCFSLESLKSPPTTEHQGIAEAISWFLPAHYSISLVSEKTIPGFQPL